MRCKGLALLSYNIEDMVIENLKYSVNVGTGELGYDGLNGTRKIGPSYAKSVI